ncbi:hypothetical protein PtrSN002B_001048, partial [Pyrenophora tritici-repentis]
RNPTPTSTSRIQNRNRIILKPPTPSRHLTTSSIKKRLYYVTAPKASGSSSDRSGSAMSKVNEEVYKYAVARSIIRDGMALEV